MTLDKLSFDGLQQALELLCLEFRANPRCLLLSEQDYDALNTEMHRYLGDCAVRIPDPVEFRRIVRIANTTTGRMMTIITLPYQGTTEMESYCHMRTRVGEKHERLADKLLLD